MNEAKIIVNQIEGCEKGIMVVEEDGFYYVGMNFPKLGVQRFMYSPAYRTVKGAERYGIKKYAA